MTKMFEPSSRLLMAQVQDAMSRFDAGRRGANRQAALERAQSVKNSRKGPRDSRAGKVNTVRLLRGKSMLTFDANDPSKGVLGISKARTGLFSGEAESIKQFAQNPAQKREYLRTLSITKVTGAKFARLESINQRRSLREKKPLGFGGGGSQPRHPAGSSKGGQWS